MFICDSFFCGAYGIFRTLALAALRHFSRSSSSMVSSLDILPPALLIKSTAPRLSALTVASVPCWVRLLNITTGVGCLSMITAKALSPSITGIFTSMVTKSGLSSKTLLMASLPFIAAPATSKSGCLLKKSVNILRMKAESSAIKTRIIPLTSFTSGLKFPYTFLYELSYTLIL